MANRSRPRLECVGFSTALPRRSRSAGRFRFMGSLDLHRRTRLGTMNQTALGSARPRLGLRQSSAAFGRLALSKSARGLAHSKTWRPHTRFVESLHGPANAHQPHEPVHRRKPEGSLKGCPPRPIVSRFKRGWRHVPGAGDSRPTNACPICLACSRPSCHWPCSRRRRQACSRRHRVWLRWIPSWPPLCTCRCGNQ